MRCCIVTALVLLASPDHLPHGSSSSPPSWQVHLLPSSGCRHPSTPVGCSAVVERSTHHPRPRRGSSAGFVGGGGSRGQRRRRKIESSTRAFHRRSPRPEACSEPRPSSVAVVLELQPREADKNKLAVYGELHRLLGTNRCRQLLGLESVATLTSLNYLILHHRDGGPRLCAQDPDGGWGGARLALGHRSWDICGIGLGGPTMESVARRAGKQNNPPVADQRRLEREIESVVKVASRSEVFPVEVPSPAGVKSKKSDSTSGASLQNTAEHMRWKLQRLYARVRAARSLALTPPSSSSSSSSSSNTSAFPLDNPLLRVGVGAVLSRRDSGTILREARESDSWVPWDGDLGRGCAVATALESLPRSRALWGGKVGDAVRARIAGLYGVPQGSVIAEASGVFVCKVEAHGAGGVDGRGETREGDGEGRESAGGVQQQRRRRRSVMAAAGFRRTKSLVTFCVALEDDAQQPSWAVCLEERGECIRPGGPGSAVIFSGKARHSSVTTTVEATPGGHLSADVLEDESALSCPPVILLRGFASVVHPSILEESARWQWGSPAWHVDAPWVKDQDILDRVWVAGGSGVDPEAACEDPQASSPLVDDAAAARAAEGFGSYRLERLNSTLAHRYYHQGLGGMGVPVVGHSGRPVVDIVEDRGLLLSTLSRLPGRSSDKTGEVLLRAVLRGRFPWVRPRRQVGKAGFSTKAGVSPRMDATLQELFGGASSTPELDARGGGAAKGPLVGVPVPPIKYVFVDPRYRGLGLGRRLFLEAMRSLARRGFRFALIVVEDNGSGGLFGFYEDMGFVKAEEPLGLPRAMIAPIPPPDGM